MATSGTYDFNPGLGEIVVYAFQNIGVRPTALLQEHMHSARMAANMMLSRWANQGVNLWAVDIVETTIVDGTATYDVDPSTIMILDAYIVVGGNDRIITPVSRSEYASYPNKDMEGTPTVFWFDRLLAPTVTLWPVPANGVTTTLKYYRLRQVQDSNLTSGQKVEIPYAWLEAFADGLTYRLARIWQPAAAVALKGQADESYMLAAGRNVEDSPIYVTPSLSGYYRR